MEICPTTSVRYRMRKLMKSIARRVSDGRMLRLIKAWLEMPVEEDDGKGGQAPPEPWAEAAEGGRRREPRSHRC